MSNSPSYQDANYTKRSKEWRRLHAFKEGREEVVKNHLEKWERESEDGFKSRQKRATLFNAVEKTIKGANGLIFKKELTYENLNQAFIDKMNDIDNCDTNLNDFAKQASELSFWYGISYILVDFPQNDQEIASYQQQIDLGIIPYFTLFSPLDVYNKRIEKNTLTQITFRTVSIENDGDFGEKTIEKFIVLNIGRGRVFVDDEMVYEWSTGLNYIPVVPVYTNKLGYLDAKPRFSNLADLNIKHMNFDSQNDKTLFIAANPIPKIFGNFKKGDSEKIVIGVDEAMEFNDKDSGDFQWEEFQGTCVDKIEAKLKALETQMATIGLSILTNVSTNTATEKVIDTAGENADLSAIASSVQWSINTAYSYWCDMMKVANSGEITVSKDFLKMLFDYNQAKVYLDMFNAGTMTIDMLWTELQQRDFLGEFDREVAKAELEAKNQSMQGI